VRAFSGTLVAFLVASCVVWANRNWVLGLWLAPMLEGAPRGAGAIVEPVDHTWALLEMTAASALLVTVPVFHAEAWLLICRLTRREEARRLTLPFSATTTLAALLAFWLVRQVEFSSFAVLL